MAKLIFYTLGGIIMWCFFIYCCLNLIEKKDVLKNWKIYVLVIVFSIIGTFSAINPMLKIIINSLMMIFIAYYFMFKNLKQTIAVVAVIEVITMICELLFVMVMSSFIDMRQFSESLYGGLLINIGVTTLCFICLKMKIIEKLYNLISASINNIKLNKMVKYSLLMIVLASALTTISYIKLSPNLVLILNTTIVILYVIIIFYMTNTQDQFQKISNKYNTSLSHLLEYEEIINKNNITSHEMKNILRTIRGMIINKEKGIDKYIEAAIKEKIEDNNKIMKQTKKIPQGGLRALLYSKLCLIEKKGIPYKLHVDKTIKVSDLIDVEEELILDICKIIGVYIDNAIDEVLTVTVPSVIIEIYKESEGICIAVTNTYEGYLDVSQIDKTRYSTKGKEHGYGLALVKELLDNHTELSNEREITASEFTQILKIKV